jgi:hypothetical protein
MVMSALAARIGRCAEWAAIAMLTALPLSCALEDGEDVGIAAQPAMNPNAMNPNAMNPNAMNPNAMNPNALPPNALSPDSLSPAAKSALDDPGSAGDLSRELIRYAVGCAFRPDQVFRFSWTDSLGTVHHEAYPGLLSLAPYWSGQPLDLAGQQWVSACLASRVNAEGVSVMLSSRGTNPALTCTATELATYQTREAAWFGNLFASTPQIYACFDPLSMLPSQLAKRVCAQPDLLKLDLSNLTAPYRCGPIEVLGPCQVLVLPGACSSVDPVERYYYRCAPSAGAPSVPDITTFLQGTIPW